MNKTVSDRGTKGNFARLFSRSVHQSFFIAVSLFFCMGMLAFFTGSVSAKEQETVKWAIIFLIISRKERMIIPQRAVTVMNIFRSLPLTQAGNTNMSTENGRICLNS